MHPYKTLLSLDNIKKFLTQGERIIAIKKMLDQKSELTTKMKDALLIIDYHKWEPPQFKIGQDRLTYFYNEDTERWQTLDHYKHSILTEINKLK